MHAETLGFDHPTTGEFMEFQVDAPEIFNEQLESLENKFKLVFLYLKELYLLTDFLYLSANQTSIKDR